MLVKLYRVYRFNKVVTDQEELLSQILESIRLSNLSGLINSIESVKS